MAEGYITKRGSTWTARIDAGVHPDGRRKQVTKSFRTQKDAQCWARETLGQLDRGTFVAPSKQTVRDYLVEWLSAVRASLRPSTHESYSRNVHLHLIPALGHLRLDQLAPNHLSTLYADLAETLSPRTVRYVHTILGKALSDAVEDGKLARNVAKVGTVRKRLPKTVTHNMTVWTGDQVATFLGQLQDDRLYTPVLAAVTTGLRRGELLGLRWRDVDLVAGRLSVRQTVNDILNPETGQHEAKFGEPKTERGRRTVKLPAVTVAALRAHRKAQLQERLLVGPDYHDRDLVFANPDGSPLHPNAVRMAFERRVARSGLPRVRFHDLRHTYATLALLGSVPAKVVSETLGHASIAITMDTYSHVLPGMQESMAETVAAQVFGS